MSDGFAYLDLIFFAMVAAFIGLRLRSVLGRRTGNERRRPDAFSPPTAQRPADNVVQLPERETPPSAKPASSPPMSTGAALSAIRQMDRGFDVDEFLQGAKTAFGMIVDAFAKGEKDALRPLLAPDVYQRFASAIDERSRRGESLSTELVAIRKAEVVGAAVEASRAKLTVRFESDQINVTRDAQGQTVDGAAAEIEQVVDIWTFERDTRSLDPNWQLTETRSPG
jgi:predicted lipid-binding transport protein (Tim44 family)